MISYLLVAVIAVLGNGVQGSVIWPQVAESKFGTEDITILRNVKFVTKGQSVKTLSSAYERYQALIFSHATAEGSAGTITEVQVEVADISEAYPQLETDESYQLTVSVIGEAIITAKTVYGALRALESFSQLVLFDYDKEEYIIPNCPITVSDSPRYPHRGLLLDTSRHFQPLSEIERTIDALSYAKYNGNGVAVSCC